MALTDKLTAIANAIRNKTGITKGLTLNEMAVAINNIDSSGGSSGVEGFGIKCIYSNIDTFLNTYDFMTQLGRLASIPLGDYPADVFKIEVCIEPVTTADFKRISKEIVEV
ncbi:MAG: hypothetical protein NC489_44740 [Ruminococcus flavefaciens]|nr:hypothetical protein [Ruminococcus flavefaciens]